MSEIKKVGILGSGIMGSGLAEVAARAGYDVVVRSRSQASADAMVASIDKGFAKAIERGKSTEEERAAVLGRIQATDHLGAVADCDLVIESVVEDLAVKKALFAELEQIVTRLESGKVDLEQSIAIYERGEALKTHCERLLKDAEARIEKITLKPDGTPSGTEPLDVD